MTAAAQRRACREEARAASTSEGARRADAARQDRIAPTPLPVAAVLAVLGGLGAWLAFPPYDQWYLLPLGLAALLAAVLVRRPVAALGLGWLWGFAFFLPLSQWANIYAGVAPWVALALFEGLFFGVFGLVARAVLARRGIGIGSGVVVACLWAGVEALRSHVPWGGLPWGASAFALQHSPLLALGPWIGTAGLAVVIGLLAVLVLAGALSLAGRRPRRARSRGLWPVTIAVLAVLACLVVPRPHNPVAADHPTMRIAGIQGNVPRMAPGNLAMPPEIFPNSLALTQQVAADARTEGTPLDLVVWPESSTGWDPREERATGDVLTAAAEDARAPLLVGTITRGTSDDTIANTSLLWMPGGSVEQTYVKRHPVPFGEYIPARAFFSRLSDAVDLVPEDMIAGTEVGVMDVGGRPVGVLICFEIAYENLVQDVVDDGAQVIVVQTNTALFGDSDEASQQLAEARVFAAISGRSVVQIATVGESAIITPEGRELAAAGHWEAGVLVADVPLRIGVTPAVAAGPWIAVGAGALGLAGLLLALASGRRALLDPARRPGRAPATRRTR
ncbi:apolipoprotein N-acyltransferase [Brachybacterium huguangmaarense]